jgi:hypothetical protein
MYRKYKDQVEFLLVYVREAHPTDGWQAPVNVREGVLLESAKTAEEKEEHSTQCVRKLNIEIPTVVDNMDNAVELNYAGWPDRLYLVGKDGRIRYKSAPGPAGFKPAELQGAIDKTLSE